MENFIQIEKNLGKKTPLYLMQKIAIICAREKSQRIKNKNLKKINGKPLIFYTIDAAVKAKIFDKIYINSESKKILNIVKKKYKNNKSIIFYQRPKIFGNGDVFVIDVIKEMIIKLMIDKKNLAFILFPTCPTRNYKDIRKIYNYYKKKKKSIMTVTAFNPPINLALKIVNKKLTPLFKKHYKKSTRHNDHTKTYYANFAVLIKKVSIILKQKNLIGRDCIPYFLPEESSIDIDEISQFNIAKKIIYYNEKNKN